MSKTRKCETACRFARNHCEALIILALFAIAIAAVAFIAPALLHDSVFWSAIASIVTILTLLYLASQSYLMTRSFDFDSQWRTKEKAVELAKFYSSSMIARINYCLAIMGEAGVMARLGAIDPKEMDVFTIDELACLSPQGRTLERWVEEQVGKVGNNVFETCRDQLPVHVKRESDLPPDNDDRGKFFYREFWSTVDGVLNDLEYLGMCFNSGVADGSVVYQSLHQSFFMVVQVFYFKIASQNSNARDRYYTHVIQLYHAWQAEYQKQTNEERNRDKQIMSPGFTPVK